MCEEMVQNLAQFAPRSMGQALCVVALHGTSPYIALSVLLQDSRIPREFRWWGKSVLAYIQYVYVMALQRVGLTVLVVSVSGWLLVDLAELADMAIEIP